MEQEYTWKRPGNKIQFQFNAEVQDNIKQCLWALENDKLDYLPDLLQDSDSKIKKRNKLINLLTVQKADGRRRVNMSPTHSPATSMMKPGFLKQNIALCGRGKTLLRPSTLELLQRMLLVVLSCPVFLSAPGILISKQPKLCRPSGLHLLRGCSFFRPPPETPCGMEDVSHAGTYHTSESTVTTTLTLAVDPYASRHYVVTLCLECD